ncbi:MAG: type II CAAX endopeptidase family protein [Rhodoglobus sp.]
MSFLRYPLTWMFGGILVLVLAYQLVALPAGSNRTAVYVLAVVGAAVAVTLYWLIMHFVAARKVPELAARTAVPQALLGIATGLVFIGVSSLVVAALGGYRFEWTPQHAGAVVAPTIVAAVAAGVVEELVFRGLALQAIEKLAGSWIALAATSVFFGLAHLGNPGATIWGAIAIAIEAGVLLGAAFLWRRSLWFVIGLHFAWNTAEGLLGIPVSGNTVSGLFTVTSSGPDILTGGAFGLEASIVPVIVSLFLAVPMLLLAKRAGHIVAFPRGTKSVA